MAELVGGFLLPHDPLIASAPDAPAPEQKEAVLNAFGTVSRRIKELEVDTVIVVGDIYILARGCSADYAYRGALGGQLAYCRSKLGNLWYARELARRHPSLRVHAVHPGVIATELGGSSAGMTGAAKRGNSLQ